VSKNISEEQKREAEGVFAKVTEGWSPSREIFFADAAEVTVLLLGGASTKDCNLDNRDGTFTTSVSYGGKTFIYVGVDHIECQSVEA